MKIKKIAAFALLILATAVYAQESSPTDEADGTDSVLQKARDKYNAQKESDNAAEDLLLSPTPTPTAPESAVAAETPTPTPTETATPKPTETATPDETATPELGFDLQAQVEPAGVPPLRAEDEKKIPEIDRPYSPAVLSVTPGLSLPWGGTYRTNLALGLFGVESADVVGLSIGSVSSVVKGELRGLQSSGIASVTSGTVYGIQDSGVVSVAQDLWGVQAAGIVCSAQDLRGVQLSGAINSAQDVWGAQVAGLVNTARAVHGTQIGLINISDSMYGIPVGLFSYTKNGIRGVSLIVDGYGRDYVMVTSGTNNFYVFAYDIFRQAGEWSRLNLDDFGLGAGYRIAERPLRLDVDLSSRFYATGVNQYMSGYGVSVQVLDGVFLPMARLTLSLPLGKRFELFCGLSADTTVDGLGLGGRTPGSYVSFPFYDHRVCVFPALFAGFRF